MIQPELNLTKRAKATKDKSLVNAFGVMLDVTRTSITNEPGTFINTVIYNGIKEYYGHTDYDIVGCIPCNDELVIFTTSKKNRNTNFIFRYIENINVNDNNAGEIYKPLANNKDFEHYGGEVFGTFTYNYLGELIITFSEVDSTTNELIPLRSINLGNSKTRAYIETDLNVQPIIPHIRIPYMSNVNIVNGRAYKGWYYFYIRYKISDNDYTQWYNIGKPIFITSLNEKDIIRYPYTILGMNDEHIPVDKMDPAMAVIYVDGCADFVETGTDIADKTVTFNVRNHSKHFTKAQIGFVCASKGYTKAFQSKDYDIRDKSGKLINITYTVNSTEFEETSVSEFNVQFVNLFNVGNIVNHNNRCYVANYTESETDYKLSQSINDNISVTLVKETISDFDYIDDEHILFGKRIRDGITFDKLFNVLPDYKIKVRTNFRLRSQFSGILMGDRDANGEFNASDIQYSKGVILVKGHDIFSVISPKQVNTNYVVFTVNDIGYRVNRNDGYNDRKMYINDKTFDKRMLDSTLIPGGIYNLFIHFVDKYGQATNGIKLNCKTWVKIGSTFHSNLVYQSFIFRDNLYYIVHTNPNVYNTNKKVSQDYIIYSRKSNGVDNGRHYVEFISEVPDTNVDVYLTAEEHIRMKYAFLEEIYDATLTWNNVIGIYDDIGIDEFIPFVNVNGETLFRVPSKNIIDVIPQKFFSLEWETYHRHSYGIKVDNVDIPNGYVGYFISYEKYENVIKHTGVLTKRDAYGGADNDFKYTNDTDEDYKVGNSEIRTIPELSKQFATEVCFYSDELNTEEKIELNFNLIKVLSKNKFSNVEFEYNDNRPLKGFYRSDIQNIRSCNSIELPSNNNDNVVIHSKGQSLKVANSNTDGRLGLSTCISIKGCETLFEDGKNDIYKVQLINLTNNIYINKNKILIRCTDVIYNEGPAISYNFNGHLTFSAALIYRCFGLNYDTGNFTAYLNNTNGKYLPNLIASSGWKFNGLHHHFVHYLQYPVISDTIYEAKSFKNKPDAIYKKLFVTKNDKLFGIGCIVIPQDTVDLFERKYNSSYEHHPLTHINYREDRHFLKVFNKTIRRSNQFKDESSNNAWRVFSVEAYKHIHENKGDIVSLVTSGNTFLVHTQHSLFNFDMRNTLETVDNNVQTKFTDVFDAPYREVFNTYMGYGGIKYKDSNILDQFGYLFYDNDARRFFRLDGNDAKPIDENIHSFVKNYNPDRVQFAHDEDNKRIIVNLTKGKSYLTLSYSYVSNTFISFHKHKFSRAYNTKTRLYYKNANRISSYYNINESNVKYGVSEFMNNISMNGTYNASISIMLNGRYDEVKQIDFVKYQCYITRNSDYSDSIYTPVGRELKPYAGNTIRIYNDFYDTGTLDILNSSSDTDLSVYGVSNSSYDYKKPYYDHGVWNYNYIRHKAKDVTGDNAHIRGNYFVATIEFDNKHRFEFENFEYSAVKDKKV